MDSLDESAAVEHFDELYQRFGADSQRRYPNEELCRFIARRFGLGHPSQNSSKRVLEIGCGSGANLWMMAREGLQVFGTDGSAKALKLAEEALKNWSATAELKTGLFSRIPYPDQFFDAVADVVSLQHATLAEHASALQEIHRVLKPGGVFFSFHLSENSFPFRYHHSSLLDSHTVKSVENREAPFFGVSTTCFISADEYRRLLTEAGFKITQLETLTRSYRGQSQTVEYLSVEAQKESLS